MLSHTVGDEFMREARSILENQELHMTNVLSFRRKLTQAELQIEAARIGQFIKDGGYAKAGPSVSATFAVDGATMDFELLIPLDKPFVPPEGCTCKPVFKLVNAISIRHIGNPATLQETLETLIAYIQKKQFQAITSAYSVTVQDAQTPDMVNQMIVDVYIGVSPNIL
jgi:hypothetical protein